MPLPSVVSFIGPFFASCALTLGVIGTFACHFVSISITLDDSSASVGVGIWNYQGWNYYATDDAIYYYKSCYSYSDSISMDAYWKTAEAFSIIATVFGGVACFVSCISSFAGGCVGSKVLAFIFMFTALCQGLCFLFLKSDACQNNPIVNQVPELNGASLSCDLSWGANCTIAATVFWFVAGALMCCLSHQESKADDDMEPDIDEEPAGKIDKEPAEKVEEETAKKVDEEPEEMVDEEPEETEEMEA